MRVPVFDKCNHFELTFGIRYTNIVCEICSEITAHMAQEQ